MMESNQSLKLTDIRTDAGTQSRVSINLGTVKEYAEKMKDGAKFDPIEVFFDGASYYLVDGFHRVAAAKSAGLETHPAKIIKGTLRDAILYSKGVNAKHGLHRSIQDKHKVVTDMLQDHEWVKWSDNKIAKYCDVSQPLVSKIRGELFPLTSNIISDNPRTYTSKSGKTATMKTGNIGKKPVTREKIDDGYTDDVPSQQIEPPVVPTTSALPPTSNPFKPAILVHVNSHGSTSSPHSGSEPARLTPGATPVGHDDLLAGAKPNGANGSAPIIPGIGKAPYTAHAIGQNCYIVKDHGNNIVMKIEGCEKIMALVLSGLNTPKEETHDDSLPFTQLKELGIDVNQLSIVIDEHNHKIKADKGQKEKPGFKRVKAILRYLRETGLVPPDALEYIKERLADYETGKKTKKKSNGKSKPKAEANPNAPLIVEILATYISESGAIDPDIYAKTTERNKAEKLHLAGVTPKHVQAYIRSIRDGKFHPEQAITLDKILREIGGWLDIHFPEWKAPKISVIQESVPTYTGPILSEEEMAAAWKNPWREERTGTTP